MLKRPELSNAEKIVNNFILSFSSGNTEQIASFLSEKMTGYVTNAEAKANKTVGREAFMATIPCDIETVKPEVKITQILSVKRNLILVMVEVNAQRKGKQLHNHAAFLIRIKLKKIDEIYMVDALPKYSDEFWKN